MTMRFRFFFIVVRSRSSVGTGSQIEAYYNTHRKYLYRQHEPKVNATDTRLASGWCAYVMWVFRPTYYYHARTAALQTAAAAAKST